MAKKEPTVRLEDITPELAMEYLALSGKNRKVRYPWVNKLTASMRQGHWDQANGDTISFDRMGKLADGQHRLTAAIAAAFTIRVFVARDVATDSYFGRGFIAPRTVADVLEMKGEKCSRDQAAVLRLLHAWKKGVLRGALKPAGGCHPEVLNWDARVAWQLRKEHPHLPQVVLAGHRHYKRQKRVGPSLFNATLLSFMAYITHQLDVEMAKTFIQGLESTPPDTQSPMYHLRKRLLQSAESRARHLKLTPLERYAMTINCWNLWVLGKSIKSCMPLRWRASIDSWPEFIDPDGTEVTYKDISEWLWPEV